MLLLGLCLLINSFIGVIFKWFETHRVDNLAAITSNYFVCLLTGSVVYGKWALPPDLFEKKWFWLAVLMGLLFIITFNLMALTVQKFGVSIATIFQKMSLIAPAILAISLYGEPAPWTKICGILLAILAIVLLSYKKGKTEEFFAPWMDGFFTHQYFSRVLCCGQLFVSGRKRRVGTQRGY
ncbi:MAG: EamA family transporter [Saprospiraceae bacterium]|nr:EamA family transporter [Saprospiraceae bacterium]